MDGRTILTAPLPELCVFADREAANTALVAAIAETLKLALDAKGKASLMLSGGSTPLDAYERLADAELDWSAVSVGLVDERWVEPDEPGSNEALVRASLLRADAAHARFLSMKTSDESPFVASSDVSTRYAGALQFDAVVLGMGNDGHTASWFPGSVGLRRAMDLDNEAIAAPIDATGAPGAGDLPLRMTLTASAIDSARRAFLLIFGDEKRAVYDAALNGETGADMLPIAYAARLLGDRLTVYWAP